MDATKETKLGAIYWGLGASGWGVRGASQDFPHYDSYPTPAKFPILPIHGVYYSQGLLHAPSFCRILPPGVLDFSRGVFLSGSLFFLLYRVGLFYRGSLLT